MPDIDMTMWCIVVVLGDGAVEPFGSHGYLLVCLWDRINGSVQIDALASNLHRSSNPLFHSFSLSLWLLQQQRWNIYHRLQDNNHFLTRISPKYSSNPISLRLKTCLQTQRQDTNHFILHSSMDFVISFSTPYNSAISYTLLLVRFTVKLNTPCANGLTQAIV